VDGVLLGGKTKAEAKIALQEAIEQRLQGGLVFQLGDRRFTVPTTVVATDDKILPISTEEGTGLVHTAVSAGAEDFKLGKKYGLPMIPVIADNADYLPSMGFLAGKNAKKHPEIIFDYLKEREAKGEKWIFLIHKYKHRYPACWRCKTELVWKVAEEWYIAMDLPKKSEVKSPKSEV
jgi:isoleucyl-tRNA synthetase